MNLQKEKLTQIAVLLGGVAVLVILIAVFFFALVPREQAKPENYLTYSFEGLKTVPEDKILYRESGQVLVPAAEISGIVSMPGGGFAVTGDQTLFVFDSEFRLMRRIVLADKAAALTVSRDGLVFYAGMKDHVEVYSRAGEKLAEWTSLGERAEIVSLAAGADVIYAADSGNKTIACFDKEGKLLQFLGRRKENTSMFLIPGVCFDVALDSAGMLWAVDPGRLRVLKLSATGDILSVWGKASPLLDGFSGCCNPVHIALFSDDSFVVQEKGIVRIILFTKEGVFAGVVAGPAGFHESLSTLDIATGPGKEVYVVDSFLKAVRVFRPKDKG